MNTDFPSPAEVKRRGEMQQFQERTNEDRRELFALFDDLSDEGIIYAVHILVADNYGPLAWEFMHHAEAMATFGHYRRVVQAELQQFKREFPHELPLKEELYSHNAAQGLSPEVLDWMVSNDVPEAEWKVHRLTQDPWIGFKDADVAFHFKMRWG